MLCALGAAGPIALFFWFNLRAYGHALGAVTVAHPGHVAPLEGLGWLLLGLAQLLVAWPLCPLGVLRSRREEWIAAGLLVLYLAGYGYHYRGPSWVATLVAGARLEMPAIALLLPGYAAWLEDLPGRLRSLALGALALAVLVVPFPSLRAWRGDESSWRRS